MSVDTTKAALLRGVHGRVLEIGAGGGRNLPAYGPDVDLVALEPSRRRRRRLRRAAARLGREVDIVPGRAENLRLPDASVDAVVATYVLCSVDDRRAALAGVARVLRPGGHFVYAEHVGAPAGTGSAVAQRVVDGVTRPFGGCAQRPDTEAAIAGSALEQVDSWRFTVTGLPGVRVPVVLGRCVAA